VALSVFVWILNDMRLEVKNLADKADNHLPRILTQTEHVTGQLDAHITKPLNQTETAVADITSRSAINPSRPLSEWLIETHAESKELK
jgi:hypothetical protein